MLRKQSPASLLSAFADPTRLRILNLLHAGPLCVGDLVSVLGVPQPTASRHLAHLRGAGLVQAEKRGLWVFYELAAPERTFHSKLIECLACCFREVPELRADLARVERLRRKGGCCPLHEPCGPAPRSKGRAAASCCP
jgi:ArsR family transcriptional regulator